MSIEHMQLARKVRGIDPTAKLILILIADHADQDGRAWPSVPLLANDVGIDHSNVRRQIRRLEEIGLLEREHRAGQSTLYTLRISAQSTHECAPNPTHERLDSLRTSAQGVCAPAPTRTLIEPPLNPDSEPNGSVVVADRDDPPERIPVQVAFENWNIAAQELGLPMAEKLTTERKRRLRARLTEHGIDGWNRGLTNLEQSPFLLGKNDREWRANFDFMLRPENLVKLIEGGYSEASH